MDNEKLIEWAEQIPMEELFVEIRRLTGLADLKFTKKINESRNRVIINFESQDLSDQVGFLKLMFKEIRITNFNSEVYNNKIPHYWGTACFNYAHPSGGSNCCRFLNFWYEDRRGWTFEQRE